MYSITTRCYNRLSYCSQSSWILVNCCTDYADRLHVSLRST